MLVLSRRADQEIRFPALDIKVRVLKANGTVKLGIDAPADIRVCRDEIEQKFDASMPTADEIARLPQKTRHEVRNQLHSISLGVHVLEEEINQGRFEAARKTMQRLLGFADELSQHRAVAGNRGNGTAQKKTVLVVEDEPNEREMLAGLLDMNGYAVTTASDGNEAIRYLKRDAAPHFVLLDLNLPGMSGDAVLDWIRQSDRHKSTSVFVTSGADKPDDAARMDFFQKPLDLRQLMKAMRKVTAVSC